MPLYLFGVTLTVTWHDYSEVPNNCWFGASYIGHEVLDPSLLQEDWERAGMLPGCYGWPSHAIRYKRTRSAVRQTVNLRQHLNDKQIYESLLGAMSKSPHDLVMFNYAVK